jgi:hypothetical protein
VLAATAATILVSTSGGRALPNAWTWFATVVIVPSAACLAIALDEARRPVRRIGTRVGDAPAPAWHPKFGHLVDEYRQTVQLNEADSPSMWSILREWRSPRVRTRVIFDDVPFRRGGWAKIRFVASVEKRSIDPELARFHLRCFREDPDVVLPWRRGIECVADLAPGRRVDHEGREFAASLEFPLPVGAPGADLNAARPTYWVFVAAIDGLDGPFRQEVFVPVA